MQVYRISKTTYADDLSGYGASLYGGRWNPKGFPVLYTAGSISLAILEYLAHNMHVFQSYSLSLCTIEIPDSSSIKVLSPSVLPNDWTRTLEPFTETQKIGAQFLFHKKYHLIKVPSVLAPHEYNYLINPAHPLHKGLKIVDLITPFRIDQRLK